jgi:capsular exopolysaccharide synthesis family protein
MESNSQSRTTLALPDLRALWRVLWEKAWLIAAIVAVCGAAGFIYAKRLPNLYEATTTVQVEVEQQRLVKTDNRPPEETTDEAVLKTIEQSLLSPALALRIVSRPELQSDPAFLPRVKRPASEERLRAALSDQISVEVRRGTRLIDVTVEDESPAMAQKLARLLVDEFLRSSVEGRVEVSRGAHAFLREEAAQLLARLSKSENALQQYKEQNRAVSIEEKQNVVGERLKELSAKVTAAKAERLKLETDRAQIQGMVGQSPERLLSLPSVAGAEEVGELRRKISEKETEIAALSRRYKSEHPRYIQAASELAELKSALDQAIIKASETLGTALDAAVITESKLEQALQAQESLALELSKITIPYDKLAREVASDRALYDALLARVKESEVGQGISQHAVNVVSPPSLPDRPSKPKRPLILLLSLATGTAIGLTVAMGSSLFDGSLRTVDQAEHALGMRSLGAIAKRPKTPIETVRRLLVDRPHSIVAENFRALRTALHFAGPKEGFRTIAITSAIPGEGKSFCAINYAIALAQHGYNTLLIDADLRLPTVACAFFGGERGVGLSDLLLARAEFDDAVRTTTIDNLSVMTAGAPAEHPAELVGSGPFPELLRSVQERFDRIVIDTAPVLAVSETLHIASQVDAVCFVVRAAHTPAAASTRALQRLRESGAKVPGFVLNGLPTKNGGYYYHYHASGYGEDEVYGAGTASPR